jgi:hypothetical protein
MAPQVGRFSLNTPIFSVMKVKQLARRKQRRKSVFAQLSVFLSTRFSLESRENIRNH